MVAPKLRFKEFSENWSSKKIIELADYVDYRGKTPKKVESGVLLVTAKNIKQGYLDYSTSQEFIEKSAFDDVMRRGKVELNDVLITTEAPLGNVASVDRTDIALAQRVIKYRGKVGLLDNLFLKQKFLSENFQEVLQSKATGGTVQGIKGSVLHQIPLIVPPIKEQTKIATFLSAVDEKIAQLSQKRHLLGQYKQGMMQKLFSQKIRFKADDGSEFGEWKLISIKEAVSFIKDGTHGTHQDDQNSELFLLSAKNLQNGRIKIDERDRKINQKEFDSIYKNYTLEAGDILLSVVGTIGRVAIFKENYKAYAFQRSVAFMRFKESLPEFIYQLFLANDFQNELLVRQVVSAQPGIYLGDLSKIEISLPCLDEQTKIANFLSAIDQKIDVVSTQLKQAKIWKKGLLQQMFV